MGIWQRVDFTRETTSNLAFVPMMAHAIKTKASTIFDSEIDRERERVGSMHVYGKCKFIVFFYIL